MITHNIPVNTQVFNASPNPTDEYLKNDFKYNYIKHNGIRLF